MNDVPRSVRVGRYITDHMGSVGNVLEIVFTALLVLSTVVLVAVGLWQLVRLVFNI